VPETDTTTTDTTTTGDESDAARRRTIIRLLVGLGIGIPVLVELATFVGLVEQSLLGDDASDDGGSTTGGTDETDGGGDGGSGDGVSVGDELLPETPQEETLSVASFRAGDDSWVLTLAAAVENTESGSYTVQFGPVTTQGDERVEGSSRAVTVDAGETGQVTGTWQLSPGSRPASVVVRTAVGETDPTAHEVELAPIPVEGN
jgi:hypothetical protein